MKRVVVNDVIIGANLEVSKKKSRVGILLKIVETCRLENFLGLMCITAFLLIMLPITIECTRRWLSVTSRTMKN